MSFFIHIADPGFPDPPWAGVRRLGPFLTVEEATAQAVADSAGGAADSLGVYTEDESEAMKDVAQDRGAPVVTTQQVVDAADLIRKQQVADRLDGISEDRAALAAILPDGITVADIEAAKAGA